jgi:hypothetical protein
MLPGLGGLAGVVLALAACTTTVSGNGVSGGASPTGSPTGSSTGSGGPTTGGSSGGPVPGYTPPRDGSGYSIKPADQPVPLPGLLTRRGCDWLASAKPKLASLGVRGAAPSASGCQFQFPHGEIAQVHIIGPYHNVTDSTTYLKPTTVAGLEARVYSFVDQKTDTICSVSMNPRSLLDITVDAYNTKETGGAFAAHCQLASKVGTALAKAYVPLAGGRPWPGTPQQPASASLRKLTACTMVTEGAIIWANDMSDKHPRSGRNNLGSTCDYSRDGYGTIHVVLTTGKGGLMSVPPAPGATVTSSHAGVMPARTEQAGKTCTYSVQLSTGQVVQLGYTLGSKLTFDPYPQTVCLAAQAAMFDALVDTMSEQ